MPSVNGTHAAPWPDHWAARRSSGAGPGGARGGGWGRDGAPGRVRERVDTWESRPTSGAGAPVTPVAAAAPTTPTGSVRFSVDLGAAAMAASNTDDLTASVVDTVSGMLGLDPADLTGRLTAGESLDDVAASAGTSHADLTSILRATLPDALTDTQAATLTARLATATWPPDASTWQIPPATGQSLDLTLTATATLLGTTPTALATQLGHGSSLTGLADTAGIAHDDLAAAITTDLGTSAPAGTDPTTLAGQIATRTDGVPDLGAPAPAPAPATTGVVRFPVDLGAAAMATASTDDLTASVVDTVSGMLGLDPADLAVRLGAGETLDDVAASAGTSHADLVSIVRATLPDALTDTQAATLAGHLTTAAWPPDASAWQIPPSTGQTLDLTLTATATLLGTTATALATQLGHGSSLSGLADTAGITNDDLVAAITTDLGTNAPAGTDPTTLAGQIATRTDATLPAPPTPPPASGATPARRFRVDLGAAAMAATDPATLGAGITSAVSDVLGLSTGDLTARLDAGDTLDTIAGSTGTGHDDLVDAIRTALPDALQGHQARSLAEQLSSSRWPLTVDSYQVPRATESLGVPLTATAALLGTTVTHLASQLGEGNSLDGLATAAGIQHGDLVAAITTDLAGTAPDGTDPATLAEQIATGTDSTAVAEPHHGRHHHHHGS